VLSKALVASAYDDMENFRSAMNSGAFDFIVKPIAFNDLKVTIYKAIADYNNNIEGLEARKKLIEAVKEKEAAILRERLRISRDLHDDIGASISGISISAITAQKKLSENNIHEAGSLLHHIAQDAHDMVTSMSEMVWLINPKNDSMEKLFDRIRTYATHVLPAKDILFSFNDEVSLNPLILSIEERKNIYLIFKEAINNAAKYSECSEVNLIVQKNKSTVDFILSDNGNGFDKSKVQFGNGLKNMQQRADEINGKFSTESNSNGTTIKLSVVLA
jgi:signal transduction histidine kinase